MPALVRLLADDVLGAKREQPVTPLPAGYLHAFEAIDGDPNQELVVACLEEKVVGTLQLTFLPGLSNQGAWRALVEAVRIDSSLRSQGAGKAMLEYAMARARVRGCRVVQLTTDKSRGDAQRFYRRLGFVASHEGMKLGL